MSSTQSVFDFKLPAAMSGQDFIVSNANRDAIEWLGNAAEWPAPALIVYGAPASGKSHLCQIWQELYQAQKISSDNLIDEERMSSILKGDGYYYIDDIDVVLGSGSAYQDGVFHAYNFLFNQGGRLLLTSTKAPKEMGITLKDLSSRLLAAPAVQIQDPDDQALQALLIKLFDDRQIVVKPDVIAFLLPRLERSYQAIFETVDGLDRFSLQGKRPITIPLIRDWIDKRDKGQQKSLFS